METPQNITLFDTVHEYRSHKQNEEDGFIFQNCEKSEVWRVGKRHPLGTIYKFKNFGYVANGYHWYRFQLTDNTPKHTPTPWKINPVETYHLDIVGNERPLYPNKKGGLQCDRICRMDDNFERRAETQANAAFIVKACNSYDEMLEALKHVEQYFKDWPCEDQLVMDRIKYAIDKATE